MKFIGRNEELKKLKREINRNGFSFSLIYGRRRVGKSELVKQALRECSIKSIYYECKQVTQESNAKGLSSIVSEAMDLPKLGYSDMESLLEYIFRLAEKEEMVLVLDEYPYLRESVKGMDSILQALIDRYGEASGLKLIVLGSYVEAMKSLLEHSNPLYGRVDLTIHLKQMDYYESSQFYSGYSAEDKVRIYSVFGGIPYYNRLINDQISVRENITELIASEGARLENEVSMYLISEISKISNANEVFEALASGYTKYSDILSQSHISSSQTLAYVLDKLIKMGVVEKVTPINAQDNRKKTKYRISDNLSLFYYRYVFRYSSQMSIMDSKVFYSKYIDRDFEEYFVPHQFEEISRQYLIKRNKAGMLEPIFERIGKYYYDDPVNHTNGEFDVVTEDENGYVFYEVKFRNRPITDSLINEEILQVKATGLECYRYAFISRSGFDCEERENVSLISLGDLYKADWL